VLSLHHHASRQTVKVNVVMTPTTGNVYGSGHKFSELHKKAVAEIRNGSSTKSTTSAYEN